MISMLYAYLFYVIETVWLTVSELSYITVFSITCAKLTSK